MARRATEPQERNDMYKTKETVQQFVEQTVTPDFRRFLEEAFQSIEELNRKQVIRITPVVPMGVERVKDMMDC
jgi:hypothetical protein